MSPNLVNTLVDLLVVTLLVLNSVTIMFLRDGALLFHNSNCFWRVFCCKLINTTMWWNNSVDFFGVIFFWFWLVRYPPFRWLLTCMYFKLRELFLITRYEGSTECGIFFSKLPFLSQLNSANLFWEHFFYGIELFFPIASSTLLGTA